MAKISGTVPISAPIAPTSDLDTFPSHLAKYGKGGLRTVATLAERNAIPTGRREEGMEVFVQADSFTYRLGANLSTWTKVSEVPAILNPLTVGDLRLNSLVVPAGTQAITSSTKALGDNQPRHYYVNLEDTTSPDDGWSTIVDAANQRWYVILPSQEIDFISTEQLTTQNLDLYANPFQRLKTGYYSTIGDDGGNEFYYDALDTTSAHDGGSVIVDAAGRRWKIVDTTTCNARQWGCKADGTNDSARAQAAINWAAANHTRIRFPTGTYKVNVTAEGDGFSIIGAGARYTIFEPVDPVGAPSTPTLWVKGERDIVIQGIGFVTPLNFGVYAGGMKIGAGTEKQSINCAFRDLYFYLQDTAIRLEGCLCNRFENIETRTCKYGLWSQSRLGTGTNDVTSATTFQNCTWTACSQTAITLTGGYHFNLKFDGCTIEANEREGIIVQNTASIASNPYNIITFHQCFIENNNTQQTNVNDIEFKAGTQGTASYYGICFEDCLLQNFTTGPNQHVRINAIGTYRFVRCIYYKNAGVSSPISLANLTGISVGLDTAILDCVVDGGGTNPAIRVVGTTGISITGSGNPEIAFGPGGTTLDTHMRRDAVGRLRFTESSIQFENTAGDALYALKPGDSQNRMVLLQSALELGPGTAARDVKLTRAGTGVTTYTGSYIRAEASDIIYGIIAPPDSSFRFRLGTDGMELGSGATTRDVLIKRTAANRLDITATAGILVFGAAAGQVIAGIVSGDPSYRSYLGMDGIEFGPGSAGRDAFLKRVSAAILEVTSALQFPERSQPTAVADKAILYARDNGSGKTQLCALFPTGAVQVLSTEP